MPRTVAPYSERLAAALDRKNVSVRGFARLLAEHEGGSLESKRRNVYKWLDRENPSEPEPLRAAQIAVILESPELALVQTQSRASRLESLSGEIDDLVARLRRLADQVDEQGVRVDGLSDRVSDLEGRARSGTETSGSGQQ